MPQIGEDLFSLLPLRLIVRGAGQRVTYNGQIVGFTDRLNTILVPDDFLKAANEIYAPEEAEKVRRVIVETDGKNVNELMTYIEDNGYVVDGGGDDSMKMLSVVRTVISVVVALGLLVSSLSFFLLLISILLLIEKNRYKNDTLHQLGYPDSKIALPYQAMAVTVDVLVWFVACIVTYAVYPVVSRLMATISPGFEPAGPGLLVLASLALCLVFSLIHIWLIRSKIRH
jgi:cell division protein FtsX